MASAKYWKVDRVYGTTAGTRFAAVIHRSTGKRVDVRIRGSKDGRLVNAWGDPYPYEETRRPQIYAEAERQLFKTRPTTASGPGYAVPAERNPPLVAFVNPHYSVVGQLSKRVYAIQYRHVDDGKNYTHSFKRGVCMEVLSDGSIRIYSMSGKRLFGDF